MLKGLKNKNKQTTIIKPSQDHKAINKRTGFKPVHTRQVSQCPEPSYKPRSLSSQVEVLTVPQAPCYGHKRKKPMKFTKIVITQ